MRPLPYLPTFPLFKVTIGDREVDHRLELWNLLPNSQIQYLVLTARPRSPLPPQILITICPYYEESVGDASDVKPSANRLVAVAQTALLALTDAELADACSAVDPFEGHLTGLLNALAEKRSPWVTTDMTLDGSAKRLLRVSWRSGSAWVGDLGRVGVAVVARDLDAADIALTSMPEAELRSLALSQ